MQKKHILIIHGYAEHPLRSAVRDLLFSFKKYSQDDVFYLNLRSEFEIPDYIKKIHFDLIIFHTVFLSARWRGIDFFNEMVIKKCVYFSNCGAVKAIMTQDDWLHTESLVKFINEIKIDTVFTLAPSGKWSFIFEGVDFRKVNFHQVLTGYIDDSVLKKVNNFKKRKIPRNIDIGYRAYKAPPWLGRHGYLKTTIAELFKKAAPGKGFQIDISTEEKDTIVGDDWYKFLLRCKFFIGVEGGSTIIDRDGSIWAKGTEYLMHNPDASFEEVEKDCFPRMDGNLGLICLSPRHLEACITETCQVLIEGEYNGILKPGIHYIELKKDFSNIDDVFTQMKDENLVKKLIENARRDIVDSGNYNYKKMVDFVITNAGVKGYLEAKTPFVWVYKLINEINERWKWQIRSGKVGQLKQFHKHTIIPRLKGYYSKFIKRKFQVTF